VKATPKALPDVQKSSHVGFAGCNAESRQRLHYQPNDKIYQHSRNALNEDRFFEEKEKHAVFCMQSFP